MTNSKDKKHLMAVYGTLKAGRGNHRLLVNAETVTKNGLTKDKFAMYSSGIPYVVKDEKANNIKVEVYKVDDEELQRIDGLEGHPGWYKREEIIVTDTESKTEHANVWLYFMNLSKEDKARLKFHDDGNF